MPRRLQKRLSLAIFFSTCSLLNLAAVDDSEVLFVCVYGDQTDADEDLFPCEEHLKDVYRRRSELRAHAVVLFDTNSVSVVFSANYGTRQSFIPG